MRILMAAQFYPPDIGGEERHVQGLARALAALGHEVGVVTTALPDAGPGTVDEAGVTVVRVSSSAQRVGRLHSDPRRPHALPVPDPAMVAALRAVLQSGRYDVIHAHNWIVNSALWAARGGGVPVVLTLHDYSHVCAKKRFMLEGRLCPGPALLRCMGCAGRHYGTGAGQIIAMGNMLARRWRERGLAAVVAVSSSVADLNGLSAAGITFDVIPNFIPDELLLARPGPVQHGRVVYAGDVSRDKGVHVLLEALARRPDRVELILAGRSDPASGLVIPERVRQMGPLRHEQVLDLLGSAGVVAVPSVWPDPCPTVVLEAMALGRPVVAAATGGIVDLVEDGVTGLLVQPGDAPGLDAAIQRIVADASLAEVFGGAARSRARAFTSSSVARRLLCVYERAVEDRSRRLPARPRPR